MEQVILGVKKFQQEIYPEKHALFESLAKRQNPEILFITCSDSRIDPSLITQTEPGSMFMIQNLGNIIPPYGTPYGGTGASIEYAVTVLNVRHIIVCGHTCCGAMSALLDARLARDIPVIRQWISYADSTLAIVQAAAGQLRTQEERMSFCIEQNVNVQMTHLKTIPSVAARLSSGQISVHGWVYHIETGSVDVFSTDAGKFVSFEQAYPAPVLVY